MANSIPIRVDAEAATALAQWKAIFAEEVCEQAKRLAAQSNRPGVLTLAHYKRAAQIALKSLSSAIHDGDAPDVEREAA